MPTIKIANNLLNGFLKPFIDEICFGDCLYEGCSHCKYYADRALIYDKAEFEKAIQTLEKMYSDFLDFN